MLYSMILEEILKQSAEKSNLLNTKQSRLVHMPMRSIFTVPHPSSFATVALNQFLGGI